MIDQWFKKDIQNIFNTHNIAVFIDETGDAGFLLEVIDKNIEVLRAKTEIDELHVKYKIEKQQPCDRKFLIYTPNKRNKLKFIREYCETSGCIEIPSVQNYVKHKIHKTLNLNLNLPDDELMSAAKVSIGKDLSYWTDICHKGSTEIFDLTKELLPFLHDPEHFSNYKYDDQLRETFYRKVNETMGWDYIEKPATTLAAEIVNTMLDGLAYCKIDKLLNNVYKSWLDSLSYKSSFINYLSNYKLPSDIDIWNCDINHPFRSVDDKWLEDIGNSINDKNTNLKHLEIIKKRNKSKQAKAMEITFWDDIICLLEFDSKNISYLNSFNECVDFYIKHFNLLDTAIRHLYTEFLNNRELLDPFHTLYKNYAMVLMDKWFKYFNEYKENQTGTLQRIIDSNNDKTAIIVGDGISYEVCEQIARKVQSKYKVDKSVILADLPSETENNMSHIYMDNHVIEPVHKKREKYLSSNNSDVKIDFINLEDVSNKIYESNFLICTHKDLDDMGETLQQKALKYFPEMIDTFAKKINIMLNSGFSKVYLITDHGYVLTGILNESDKLSVNIDGEYHKAERYISAVNTQVALPSSIIEIEKKHGKYNYLYLSNNLGPFKTTGAYGYSHGGASPQELITPFFSWEANNTDNSSLQVSIDNKDDLRSVTGDLFLIKIKSNKGEGDLFSITRKVYLIFFSNKKQIGKSNIINISSDQTLENEFTFDGHNEIEVQLLDAHTKYQLDRTVVKKNQDRDLGGLL